MNEHEQSNEMQFERTSERPGPRIYVASLSDYNDGRLYGTWIDVNVGAEEIAKRISEMMARSQSPGAEEWAIHDFEGFGPLSLSEYEDIGAVSRLASGIAEHGEAFAHWASIIGSRQPDELDLFTNSYQGCFESVEAYVEQLLEDMGIVDAVQTVVADSMIPYVTVDFASFARDLELSGDIASAAGSEGVYVFDMRQ
jgi:antirestriction protein